MQAPSCLPLIMLLYEAPIQSLNATLPDTNCTAPTHCSILSTHCLIQLNYGTNSIREARYMPRLPSGRLGAFAAPTSLAPVSHTKGRLLGPEPPTRRRRPCLCLSHHSSTVTPPSALRCPIF